MPEKIRQRLAEDPKYLEVLRQYQDRDYSPNDRRYWCFPQFSDEDKTTNQRDLERSVTPNRGSVLQIENETIDDYLNFPDPQLYMVGFITG